MCLTLRGESPTLTLRSVCSGPVLGPWRVPDLRELSPDDVVVDVGEEFLHRDVQVEVDVDDRLFPNALGHRFEVDDTHTLTLARTANNHSVRPRATSASSP